MSDYADLKRCPACGEKPTGHELSDGGFKYGRIVCQCGVAGPDARTDYKEWPHWRDAAVQTWNDQPYADNLRAENVRLKGEIDQLRADLERQTELRRQEWNRAEGLKADAARYRWLREQEAEQGVAVVSISQWLTAATCVAVTFVDGSFVDVAIDRAMAREPEPRNPNTGHGHVFPRPDGARTRCGGPKLCQECAADAAKKEAAQ